MNRWNGWYCSNTSPVSYHTGWALPPYLPMPEVTAPPVNMAAEKGGLRVEPLGPRKSSNFLLIILRHWSSKVHSHQRMIADEKWWCKHPNWKWMLEHDHSVTCADKNLEINQPEMRQHKTTIHVRSWGIRMVTNRLVRYTWPKSWFKWEC